jgi:hypothetical protein
MKHPFLVPILLLLFLSPAWTETNWHTDHLQPDTVVMNDGRELHGLIIRNNAKKLILQQRMGEVEIPKNEILRIDDQPDSEVFFADIVDPHKLPPWRMIVQDLRSDDSIKSFRQIPATTIDNGYLRKIPYLSFRINKRVEMNVYGNPENPVCLEFGVYERGENITKFKKIIRAYMAGILQSREEIAALYGLDEKGGMTKVGNFVFQVTPPTAPDAYGGWWISIFDQSRLDRYRVPDAIYRKNTLPFSEVNHGTGDLRRDKISMFDRFLNSTQHAWAGMIPNLRGFYRDGMGALKLDTSSHPVSTTPQPTPNPKPKLSPVPIPAPAQ